MNSFNNRNSVFLISGIMVFVATASFFVVPFSVTFIIAFLFTLLAIAMFCAGNLYMLSNPESFPWLAAFPMTIWQYLLAQLSLSATFVIRSIFFESAFSVGLLLFLHILLIGLVAVRLLLIKGGKKIIEDKDAEVKAKVSTLRFMQADVETIMRNNPEHEKPLKQVAEALRYSDPMSHSAVGIYEEQIHRSILSMFDLESNNVAKIPDICDKLLKQIADRNSRVKIMK